MSQSLQEERGRERFACDECPVSELFTEYSDRLSMIWTLWIYQGQKMTCVDVCSLVLIAYSRVTIFASLASVELMFR